MYLIAYYVITVLSVWISSLALIDLEYKQENILKVHFLQCIALFTALIGGPIICPLIVLYFIIKIIRRPKLNYVR